MRKLQPRDLLSHEDRHLWKRVAETTEPLSQERGALLKDEMSRLMQDSASAASYLGSEPIQAAFTSALQERSGKPQSVQGLDSHPLENQLVRNIKKGRHRIDGRIDLHGTTQDRARGALLEFLQYSQQADHRIVLVITGKGNRGQGVLRRIVPQWLALPAFLPLVNGYREAHISHGGEGALYVRLRRHRR